MSVYILSYSSFSLSEGVLDGGIIDIYQYESDAQHDMRLNVNETSNLYPVENHKELLIENRKATFETKDGYLIEYKITKKEDYYLST